MKYCIMRVPVIIKDGGLIKPRPYRGKVCVKVNIEPGMWYSSFEKAERYAKELSDNSELEFFVMTSKAPFTEGEA